MFVWAIFCMPLPESPIEDLEDPKRRVGFVEDVRMLRKEQRPIRQPPFSAVYRLQENQSCPEASIPELAVRIIRLFEQTQS